MVGASALIFGAAIVLIGLWLEYPWWILRAEPAMPSGQRLNLGNGLYLYYVREGRGPTIVLLHGWGASMYAWRRVWKQLTPHFDVIAIDLLGHGFSSKPLEWSNYRLDHQLECIERSLDLLQVKNFMLIGSSLGGGLSFWLAERLGPRVQGIVALAPAVEPKLMKAPFQMMKPFVRWLSPFFGRWAMVASLRLIYFDWSMIHRECIRQHLKSLGPRRALGLNGILATAQCVVDRRLPKSWKNVFCPVILARGKFDRIIPRASMDGLFTDLPNCIWVDILNCGHHPQEDRPDIVAQLARALHSLGRDKKLRQILDQGPF